MPQLFVSTGAMKHIGFDSPEIVFHTIKAAHDNGFDGAQIYVNDSLAAQTTEYLAAAAKAAAVSKVQLIAHLPNEPKLSHVTAARNLLEYQPAKPVIVHYPGAVDTYRSGIRPNMQRAKQIGLNVHLENTLNGLESSYYTMWVSAARADNFGTVLDIDRLFKSQDAPTSPDSARHVLRSMMQTQDFPDMLHVIDRLDWPLDRRIERTSFGSGVYKEFMDLVRSFDGPVVFEHEDLESAVKSKNNVLNGSQLKIL